MQVDPRRPQRQDTYDLRDQISSDERQQAQDNGHYGAEDEERSVLEDDSEQEDADEFMDDDMSSTLSIPNEAIDFDMVYALHSFAATVEGQANVVKGDSLYLMDDSNSYWWLVRVLKTQEVGYIPAENIETPFERLARLNKHRNIDLATATPAEQSHGNAQEQALLNLQNSNGGELPPRVRGPNSRNIHFTHIRSNYHYIPPLRDGEEEDEDDEWEVGGFEDEDPRLLPDDEELHETDLDDSMQWEDAALEETNQARSASIPDSLLPASSREQEKQRMLRLQQQQQLLQQQQQQQERQAQEQEQQRQIAARSQAASAASQSMQESRDRAAQESPVESRRVDPAEVTETFKLTATPTIAREYDDGPGSQGYAEKQREEERLKRQREEDEEAAKKKAKGDKAKMAPPVSSSTYNKAQQPGKLRKEPSKEKDKEPDADSKDKKKKSVFGSLWSRKKDKPKEKNGSIGSMDSNEYLNGRTSEESNRGPRPGDGSSPTTTAAQQQQHALRAVSSNDFGNPQTPERIQVSQHANSLRQRDEQQMKLYQQQYLTRSPSSPPEASLSASLTFSPSNSGLGPPTQRARPGSLILTSPSSNDGQANLNVIRVFAGKHLQTDATFKTALLNPNTTASDLIRQALQRFRLPAAEEEGDYYLTVKQVEGGAFAVLQSHEKPLVVFETLVSETELPKVKRSSVGSISSISSNLSMHPAIKKLSMNDFTDDSAVKFYLNRRRADGSDDSITGHEGDDTIIADTSHTDDASSLSSPRSQTSNLLSPTGSRGAVSDRFTSPSIRFPLQLVIYAEDLPDDMQFHPETEAIVFKHSLPNSGAPVVVSPTLRRKVFIFPKNVTVAEVTEIGLERFGIQDGVVDGGDEVEDKATKRRSVVRVRYGLTVSIDGQERELTPSSKVVDAFPRPPAYRQTDRQQAMNKRRSLDAAQLLGTVDDIRKDDPVFVLRRATSYRSSTSRRRMSAPLDEIALQHLHRESMSSYNSDQNVANTTLATDGTLKQPSRQEIIAAQRAATRATQRAIVTTQSNSDRGMDVLLPGNTMLRSSRYDADDKMRYSYVEADGEAYDVSDIIEEEWGNASDQNDLLEGVADRNKDGIGEKLDRMLHKIRKGKGKEKPLGYTDSVTSSNDQNVLHERSGSESEYSGDEGDVPTQLQSRTITPSGGLTKSQPPGERPGTTTPTHVGSRRNPSVASVQSNYSTDPASPPSTQANFARNNVAPADLNRSRAGSRNQPSRPSPMQQVIIPKDDFGLSQMMAIIDLKASAQAGTRPTLPSLDPVDELLFGAPIDLESLHPQVRDIYASGFKQLEDIDKILDSYIARSVVGAF